MEEYYRHTQIGYLILVIMAVLLPFLYFVLGVNKYANHFLIIIAVILGVFSTLTVVITEDNLKIMFGWIIRKKFVLADIDSCKKVKNKWWYGWGIRYTPHGWLFNVSGFDAVEITMKNGKRYRIGTDDVDRLVEAIEERFK